MSLSNFIKGWVGETMGAAAHWLLLDQDVYKSINNITLPARGGTTQIDHVIVSRHGIFVVEAKNIDGWIFGDEKSPQWTIARFGQKHRMQNPLHQNFRHTKALAEFLNIEHDKLHSLVMFWGECEFKTPMPLNVLRDGYTSYIKGFTRVLFTEDEVSAIVDALRSGMMPKTLATRREHLASLEARHSSKTVCPKCAKPLVLRTVKSGARTGTKFYGCSGYPGCRFTAPYEDGTE